MKRLFIKAISLTLVFTHLLSVTLKDISFAAEAKTTATAKKSSSSSSSAAKTTSSRQSASLGAAQNSNLTLQSQISSGAGFNLSVLQSFQSDPFTGKASFSVPIALPAGRRGIQPNIALAYSSGTTNDIIGVGWGLGLGSIERSTKKGAPKYDLQDTFVFNSGSSSELVCIGGNEYRPKIEAGFMKFVFDGTAWIVTDKSGTKYYFGSLSHSRQGEEFGRVFKWCLDRVEDVFGNYLIVTYIKDQAQVYPQLIEYTGNSITGLSPCFNVKFDYDQNRQDSFSNYRSGFKVITALRLSDIRVRFNQQLIRRYHLEYTASSDTSRSLLRTVTQYGSDDSATLPPVTFEYEEPKPGWKKAAQTIPVSEDFNWTTNLADVNNDGLSDIITVRDRRGVVYLGTKDGSWQESPAWAKFPPDEDFITDGRADIGFRFADINGDGWVDIIQHIHSDSNGSTPAEVYLNNKTTGWDYDQVWSQRFPCEAYFVHDHNRSSAGHWYEAMGYSLVDANCDGLVDIIRARSDGHEFYLNTGSGWAINPAYQTPSEADFSSGTTQLGDINGDGLTDLVVARSDYKGIFINTGNGWQKDDDLSLAYDPQVNFSDSSTQLVDINGDGLSDIVVASGSQRKTLLNKGASSHTWRIDNSFALPDGDLTSQAVRFADSKGRYLFDILIKSSAENKIYLNNNYIIPAYLKRVVNGIGGEINVAYQPSISFDNTGGDGICDLPFSVYVVESVTVHDSLNPQSPDVATRYEYKNGYFDFSQREFRGFGYFKVIDAEGNFNESYFRQDEVYKGRPYLQQSKDALGRVYAKAESTWKHKELYPGVNFVYLEKADDFIYDASDTSAAYELNQKSFQYDDYGNPVRASSTGAAYKNKAKTTQTKTQITEYSYNTRDWLLSCPKHTYLLDDRGVILSQKWFYYDGNNSIDQPPTKGSLTKEESWLYNPLTREEQRIAQTYGYDNYGNLTSSANAKGAATSTTYDSISYIYPVRATNSLGHTIETIYYALNDANDGLPIRGSGLPGQVKYAKDANGQGSYNIYDSLGRLVQVIGPKDTLDEPGVSYEYDLNTLPAKITKTVKSDYSAALSKENPGSALSLTKANRFYNGASDYIGIPDSDYWNFGSGDFTIDFWARFDNAAGIQFFLGQDEAANRYWRFFKNENRLQIECGYDGYGNRGRYWTEDLSWAGGVWYHLAFVRSGSAAYIFRDGVSLPLRESAALDAWPDLSTALVCIGSQFGSSQFFSGWLDEVRVSKGAARWAGNFTPVRGEDDQGGSSDAPAQAKYLNVYQFIDGLGRVIETKSPAEAYPLTQIPRQIISGLASYDSRGKVKESYLPYYVDSSAYYEPPRYDTPHNTLDYDPLGRVITNTASDGSYSNTIYSNLATTVVDENGHQSIKYSDGFGKIVKVEEYKGADGRAADYSREAYTLYSQTYYEYDTLGNLTKVIDHHNNTTTITYDSLGRKIQMDDPDMGIWSYEYDSVGNLIKQTDAKAQVLTFEYDQLNRLTAKWGLSPTGTVPILLARYLYEDPAKSNCIGRLSKVSDQSGSTEFFYDELGREVKSVKKVGSVAYTVERSYDAIGRLTSLAYPDSTVVHYTYNPQGIEKVFSLQPPVEYVKNIDYYSTGQLKKIEYANGAVTEYDYDPNTLRLAHLTTNSPAAGTLQDLSYRFDLSGNIRSIADSIHTASQDFSYDHLSRLISAQGIYGSFSYGYDEIGNMTYKEGVTLSYGKQGKLPHAVTSYGSTSIDYDLNGNMTAKGTAAEGGLSLSYDLENRLARAEKPLTQEELSSLRSITLKPGWNTISFNGCLAKKKVKDAFISIQGKYGQLSRYNPGSQQFEHFLPDKPSFSDFEELELGRGYQIYITSPEEVTLKLEDNLQDSYTLVTALKPGWNLVHPGSLGQPGDYYRYNKTLVSFEKLTHNSKGVPGHLLVDEAYFTFSPKACSSQEAAVLNRCPSASFTYDGDGGLVRKTSQPSPQRGEGEGEGAASTVYIGSLFEKRTQENADSTQTSADVKHIFAGSNRVCSITTPASQPSPQISYYHSDHLGSSNIITDKDGNLLQHCEYTPYGSLAVNEVIASLGSSVIASPEGAKQSHITHYFTGKELLDSIGLYHYGARFYDPELGRFITADTIVQSPYDPQSLNRYSYCRNNPVNYVDPTGHWSWKKFWHAAVGVFVGVVATMVLGPGGALGWASTWTAAGAMGGALGGAITGGLDGGWKGALIGGAMGGALGALGGWASGIKGGEWIIGGMFVAGAAAAGATDSWDSFAGGLAGAAAGWGIGSGINSLAASRLDQTPPSPGRPTNGSDGEAENALKVDIKEGYEDMKNTQWAKTSDGKLVVKNVNEAINKGNVSVNDLPPGTQADYRLGKIRLNSRLNQNEVPGRLAHEGTHMLQHRRGELKIYDFPDERAAFNAGYAVDSETNVYGAYNPTDDEIRTWYKPYFNK